MVLIFSQSISANNRKIIKFLNYDFVFKDADSTFAKILISKVTGSLKNIENFFDYSSGSVVTIIMTRSEKEYVAYTHNRVPEWSQAVAIPENKIIILKIVKPEEIGKSPEIVLHEIVHIVIGERFPGRSIPVWLNEGLAQYLSGYKFTFNDKILFANAIAANKIPDLNSLDSLLEFNTAKAKIAYLGALSAVEYIIKEHGLPGLKNLLQHFGSVRSPDKAFKSAFGYDFIDFELRWYQDIEKDYKWLVVLNFDNLLWIFIGLLAVLAILVIRLRNRKKLNDWEQIEEQSF